MSKTNVELKIRARLVRIAGLKDEYYEDLQDPVNFINQIKHFRPGADVFTFVQNIVDKEPHYDFRMEWANLAVLRISTYEHWWKNQINDKTRNMVRRAQKAGVKIRFVEFNDEFVKAIKDIYDESPIRQDKPFIHYKKDLENLKRIHITFLERSDFIGAYEGEELIGFVKLVHGRGYSSLMQIISKISSRNKAPTNALIAKAVEVCAEKKIVYLHYGIWSKRGLGEFKKHHAFERHKVPRYFVPLTSWGRVALRLGLHRKVTDRLPVQWLKIAFNLKNKWNYFKYRNN